MFCDKDHKNLSIKLRMKALEGKVQFMRFGPLLLVFPAVVLSACSTTVIDEEDRKLPPPTAKVTEQGSDQ